MFWNVDQVIILLQVWGKKFNRALRSAQDYKIFVVGVEGVKLSGMVAADELAAVAVAHHTEHYTEDNHVDFNHDVNDDDNDNVERDETAMQVQLGFINYNVFYIWCFKIVFSFKWSYIPISDRSLSAKYEQTHILSHGILSAGILQKGND